jgi:hypothetical protein
MRVTRHAVTRSCAVCERTLLLGERTVRFSPASDDEFVDVCPLCQEIAIDHGWLKEGSPTTPTVPLSRRRRRLSLASLFEQRSPSDPPVATAPILRRLSEPELAMVEAADLYNSSPFRRTVGGIAKSLGEPRASVVPLSGVNRELVITIAWDISWYQYRVSFDAAQPVRLAERGLELDELESSFREWNARVEPDGRVVPNIARV